MKDYITVEELKQMLFDDKEQLKLIDQQKEELNHEIFNLKKQIKAAETILERFKT